MKKLIPLLFLTSCAGQTLVELPSFGVESWQEERPQTKKAEINHGWWNEFGDEILNQLVVKAQTQSPDIKMALARIEAARAAEERTIASQFPIFSAGANAGRDKRSQTLTSRPITSRYSNNFSTGFDAVWEFNPANYEPAMRAAEANELRVEEAYKNVLVTLAGDVAREYFEIRKLQQQIKVAESNIAAQRDIASLTNSLVEAGKVSGADKADAETLLASTIANVTPLKQQIAESTYRLETLLGEKPGALRNILAAPGNIRLDDREYALASPANVLAERPDIKAAEEQVKYAAALKDVAFAQYYPTISITAFLGLETGTFSKLFNSQSNAMSLAGGIAAPIFDFGRIRADIKEQSAAIDEALGNYEKTVLTAFSEVESAVNAIESERRHYRELQQAYDSSKLSFDLANERYTHGLSPYLNVLESQKNLNATEQALAISKANILINQIRLYKALGGGWKGEEKTQP